jgi:hypothetical protein
LTQRHHTPVPNASSVEKMMNTIWKALSDI